MDERELDSSFIVLNLVTRHLRRRSLAEVLRDYGASSGQWLFSFPFQPIEMPGLLLGNIANFSGHGFMRTKESEDYVLYAEPEASHELLVPI